MPLTLPLWLNARSERSEQGLRPFSQEWLAAAPELRASRSRRMPDLPDWMPSERILAAILVMLLVVTTVITSGGGVPRTTASIAAPKSVALATGDATRTPESAVAADETPDGATTETSELSGTTPTPAGSDIASTSDETGAVGGTTSDAGEILPHYRIVSYYGHPHDATMGILGEYDMNELLGRLMDEVEAYEQADPSRPVLPAFELIASVAQNWPGEDGEYLGYTDSETIQRYVDFTRDNDMILILDLQIGHSTITNEIDRVREWLAEPHVHLALDPEFALSGDDIPGEVIGGIDAADVTVAQAELAEIVAEYNLPPKMLIVHKFKEGMVTNVDEIERVPGVQIVIDFDGHGDPSNKIAGYNLFLVDEDAEFAGIKLFYLYDEPVMTAEEILALDRPPDLVVYQ